MEQTNVQAAQTSVNTAQPAAATENPQQEPVNLSMGQVTKALQSDKLASIQRQTLVREFGKNYGNQNVLRLLKQVNSGSGQVIQRWFEENTAQTVVSFISNASITDLRGLITNFDSYTFSSDHVEVNLPAPLNQTIGVSVNDATELRSQTVTKLIQLLMEDLANGRTPLAATMNNAANESDRRTAMVALHNFDTPRLTELRQITANRSNRWQHPNAQVQDGVLAAIQLDAVFNAEGYLNNPQNAHTDSARTVGMGEDLEWCGFFVAQNYITSNLDRDLARGFFATENVVNYFTYNYEGRVQKWIFADGQWQELRTYHDNRSSLRTWIDAGGLQASELDIRPGDVVLVDWHGSDRPDHIQMVQSWNPQSRELFYIDGNGGGYIVDNHPRNPQAASHEPLNESETEAATGRNLTTGGAEGHVGVGMHDLNDQPDPDAVHRDPARARRHARVFGVGRPSIVDFEDHYYDHSRTIPQIPPRPRH